jgi:hypothetical protein
MGKKIKKRDNFLDFIPKKNNGYQWGQKENGLVQIIVPRDGVLDKIVRKLFKTPKQFIIDMDYMGSFICKNIDGTNNIMRIGELLREEFGEEAEPLYERLATYINTLRNNRIIILEKAGD